MLSRTQPLLRIAKCKRHPASNLRQTTASVPGAPSSERIDIAKPNGVDFRFVRAFAPHRA